MMKTVILNFTLSIPSSPKKSRQKNEKLNSKHINDKPIEIIQVLCVIYLGWNLTVEPDLYDYISKILKIFRYKCFAQSLWIVWIYLAPMQRIHFVSTCEIHSHCEYFNSISFLPKNDFAQKQRLIFHSILKTCSRVKCLHFQMENKFWSTIGKWYYFHWFR